MGGRGGMEIRRRRSTQDMTEEEKEEGARKRLVGCKRSWLGATLQERMH